MTTAGAVQQPITTFVFAINNTIPLRKVLIVGVFGIIGVFIGFHIITALSIEQLQWLLIFVIGYNIVNLSRSYFKDKK
ncbi:putative membrane protein [Francisella frigiditurris]|uniref:Putative membrane protein n=1 Tax=Francisella frigiditurris TaxID=1542390 RepID=A0A1J0KW28_9GAMM|nr:putative membrane protein [Francisella frigiditurris]